MNEAFTVDEPIRVLAAVVERSGKFLVCQRPLGKRHGGMWEFPGGKLEPGETLAEAAARELHEELGVDAVVTGASVFSVRDAGSPFLIEFVPTSISGEPQRIEHADMRWLAITEIEKLALAPSDRRFVHFLLDRA